MEGFTAKGYDSNDIRKLAQDIISALGGYLPGTGVSVISGLNVANLERSETAGIVENFKFLSIQNTGEADGQLIGATIHPGEIITLPAILSDLYDSVSYDASGTEFLILTIKKSI